MRVAVLGFGSVWRWRIGKDPSDPKRFVRAAYYNTTGVSVRGLIRTRPEIVGHARFNGVGGFNPNYPSQMINQVFDCEEPCIWQGQVKVLFKQLLSELDPPDYYLVVVTHVLTGHMAVGDQGWKSENALLISLSEWHDQQEAMFLMPAYSWLRSKLGTFVLEPHARAPWSAVLRLSTSS
jgi:hypothetical protein